MTDTVFASLARAQKLMSQPKLNKINPHFRSKYADLAEILRCALPALNEHGLTLVQRVEPDQGQLCLVTQIFDGQGESVSSYYPLDAEQARTAPQKFGAALTYAKRYSISSLLGLAADEDDDGNAAQANAKAKPKLVTMGQVKDLRGLLELTDSDEAAFCKRVNIAALDQLAQDDLAGAVDLLKQKAERLGLLEGEREPGEEG